MPFFGKLFNRKNESEHTKNNSYLRKSFHLKKFFFVFASQAPFLNKRFQMFGHIFLWNDFLDEPAKEVQVTVVVVIDRNGVKCGVHDRLFFSIGRWSYQLFHICVNKKFTFFVTQSAIDFQLWWIFTFVVDSEIAVDVQDIFSVRDGVHSAFKVSDLFEIRTGCRHFADGFGKSSNWWGNNNWHWVGFGL